MDEVQIRGLMLVGEAILIVGGLGAGFRLIGRMEKTVEHLETSFSRRLGDIEVVQRVHGQEIGRLFIGQARLMERLDMEP